MKQIFVVGIGSATKWPAANLSSFDFDQILIQYSDTEKEPDTEFDEHHSGFLTPPLY